MTLDDIGSAYSVPKTDHHYIIKHGLLLGPGFKKETKRPPSSYMAKIEKRALRSVDPRKYSHPDDWIKTIKIKPNIIISKTKNMTMTEEICAQSRKTPGPNNYKNDVK